MKAISVYIQLNNITLRFCERFTVESTWDTFTDIAMVVVPNVVFKSESGNTSVGLDALLKKGDPVEIKAGYNKSPKQLISLFKGFISNVKTGMLLEIKAQDAMYALKQKNLASAIFKSVTLGELIDYITEGLDIETELIDPDVVLGDWAIENNSYINSVQVLDKLKNDYGFVSYIKDGTLKVGVPYDTTGTTHYLLKEINFAGPDNLMDEQNDTLRVLKGISILPDNTRLVKYAVKVDEEVKVGDEEVQGELRTLNYYNLTAPQLEEALKRAYQKTNLTGLKGDFTTFGEPVIKYNDYVKLRDLREPERNGIYKVKKVIYSMSPNSGLRQNVTIDFGISEVQANT